MLEKKQLQLGLTPPVASLGQPTIELPVPPIYLYLCMGGMHAEVPSTHHPSQIDI